MGTQENVFLLGGIWARFGAVFGCYGVMGVSDGPPRLTVGAIFQVIGNLIAISDLTNFLKIDQD